MILELFTIMMLFTPQECLNPETGLSDYDDYIDYQLKTKYTEYSRKVEFIAYIPKEFHEHINKEADRAGWYVSIEQIRGFYGWEETYRFTFTAK